MKVSFVVLDFMLIFVVNNDFRDQFRVNDCYVTVIIIIMVNELVRIIMVMKLMFDGWKVHQEFEFYFIFFFLCFFYLYLNIKHLDIL